GPGGQPPGPAPAGPQWQLPGETVAEGVHPESRRPATAARYRIAGRQDRSTGGRRGAQRHLRGGLSRLLLRIPAGARTSRRAGRAGCRDRREEGELDNRRGYPRLLGSIVTLLLC